MLALPQEAAGADVRRYTATIALLVFFLAVGGWTYYKVSSGCTLEVYGRYNSEWICP